MTDCYYKVRQVSQSVTDYYCKMRQVLQSATVITKSDVTREWDLASWSITREVLFLKNHSENIGGNSKWSGSFKYILIGFNLAYNKNKLYQTLDYRSTIHPEICCILIF